MWAGVGPHTMAEQNDLCNISHGTLLLFSIVIFVSSLSDSS